METDRDLNRDRGRPKLKQTLPKTDLNQDRQRQRQTKRYGGGHRNRNRDGDKDRQTRKRQKDVETLDTFKRRQRQIYRQWYTYRRPERGPRLYGEKLSPPPPPTSHPGEPPTIHTFLYEIAVNRSHEKLQTWLRG